MTAVAVQDQQGNDVAASSPRGLMLRPVAKVAELLQVQQEIGDVITQLLKDGTDYGKIPGVDKPSLFKAGAERTTLAFGCVPTYSILTSEIDHMQPVSYTKQKKVWRNQFKGDRDFHMETVTGEAQGFYRYVILCRIVNRSTGEIVGEGVGSASTLESKYIDRPRDLENTVLKMAQKRAFVAGALNAFALSDRFTQDVEDGGTPQGDDRPDTKDLPLPGPDTIWPFGKHKGKKVSDLDRSYIDWCTAEEDRKFGDADSTKVWQEALRAELNRRDGKSTVEEVPTPTTEQRQTAAFLLALAWKPGQLAFVREQIESVGDDGPAFGRALDKLRAKAIELNLIPRDFEEVPAALQEDSDARDY